MNRFAFGAASFFLKNLYYLSKAKVEIHGAENIPKGSVIFTINHFTRVETLILPLHIEKITKKPVWSLAWHGLFKGAVSDFLEKSGALSTRDPNRDRLILNKLLTGSANWIIFPEGSMIKTKKVLNNGDYEIVTAEGVSRPKTGAANFALRCEFYRQRLRWLKNNDFNEFERIKNNFGIPLEFDPDFDEETFIVPVNLTYYPIRARENAVNKLASYFVDTISDRINEEIMTEGAMLLDGVDIDIRFGNPIKISPYLDEPTIRSDIESIEKFDFDDNIASLKVLRENSVKIMYRYMSAIYGMTTVNHDHIFSYILKYMPSEKIDPLDFKMRTYLAAEADIEPERLFLHKALRQNQISLLTDDRFSKYAEFIEFCSEKGIVEIDDGKIIKNNEKIYLPENSDDFRKINPVAVFANEIEPIIVLGPHLERLSKESSTDIKRRVVAHILKKHSISFKNDFDFFSKMQKDCLPDENSGMPKLFYKKENKKSIVLMHGFLSSPQEMKGLGTYLNENGFNIYYLRFPGHGTSPENLENISYEDFIYAGEEALVLLNLLSENVFVCGISLGAAAASILASRLDFIKKTILLNPPLKFIKYFENPNEKDGFKSVLEKLSFRKNDENKIKACIYPRYRYSFAGSFALREMKKISEEMSECLVKIVNPCLVIQSYNDPLVDPKSGYRVFEKISSEDKSLLYINSREHSIINSDKKDAVFENIKMFIDE
ncbi:MAG: alpha/beta fold hydrolase [Desulfobacteraceae bacterium]|nr:alpha/beta fold hydrolase [Desulfobacteraceae bacterium]